MPKVEESKTVQVNIRFQQPLYDWLEEEAKRESMNVSEFARYLLLGIKRRGEK